MTTTLTRATPPVARRIAALLPATGPTPWRATAHRTTYTDSPAALISDGTREVVAAFHDSHVTLAWARRGEGATYPIVAVPSSNPTRIAREIMRSALPDLDTLHAPNRTASDFLDDLRGQFAARGVKTNAWSAHGTGTSMRTWRRGRTLLSLETARLHRPTLNLQYGDDGSGTLADFETLLPLFLPTEPRHPYKPLGDDITGGIPRRLYARFSHAPMRQLTPYGALSFGNRVGPTGVIETPDYRARARDHSPVRALITGIGLDFLTTIVDQLADSNA
ncbi:hypothetical protein [Streptomyces sp. MBT27]|uniref:hypothetical protein n=1 Tax=Streptomyces sp. MBT27 TaxID=1488356 RepID=UPI00141D92BE|nr:hypothetical protein [Streptomyces sp. MBT27]